MTAIYSINTNQQKFVGSPLEKEDFKKSFIHPSSMITTKNQRTKTKKEKIIAVSGYFDPIHVGHIEYLKLAKQLGGKLIVILNNDYQCILKKGKPFMKQEERSEILRAIKYVDEVFISIDKDESVCESLKAVKPNIFAKGGDRFSYEIPEAKICKDLEIKIVDRLGKKIQSSSNLTGVK